MKVSESFLNLTDEGRDHFYASIYTTIRTTQKMSEREKYVALQVLRVVGMGIQEMPDVLIAPFNSEMTDEQKALADALFDEDTQVSGMKCQVYIAATKHLDPEDDEDDDSKEEQLMEMLREALRNSMEEKEEGD